MRTAASVVRAGAGRPRVRLHRKHRHGAQVDRRPLRPKLAGRRVRVWLGPGGAVGGGEHRALRDQLGLGLLDERVLIDSKEDRSEARERGDEQEGDEEDGAQPKARPAALRGFLQAVDQAASPRQRPIL
jgi:hypothetical protein